METILLVLHILVAAGVVGFVLLQQGKGADMGAAFGSGSAGSFFGAAGSANFLSRSTAILAAVFFVSSLGLGYLSVQRSGPPKESLGVMEKLPAETGKEVPATPATGAAPAPESGKAKDIPN